ncbi:MAG: alpha/beta fold hydrolase [Calditrichaeota bacterium]|nr:alpha/beta fold hydrolase [Calditrichota bacterium]
MKRLFLTLLFLSFAIHAYADSNLHIARLGDFVLESGDTLKDLRVGYRTFGQLNQEKSNAILNPTWFGGTSEHLSHFIGPNNLIDSTGYFIICVDALGNGVSSSPSNSELQPGDQFPVFTIRDMVNSQYLLLTKVLGIENLYGIIGGSMGSMQVLQWIVSYPDFIDKAVAYVCTPKPSTFDLLIFHTYLQIIESGKKSRQPENEILKTLRMTQALIARTPEHRVQHISREEFADFLASFDAPKKLYFTVDNWEYQTRAMISHDITRSFGGSMEKAAATIKAKVFIIVAKQDHYINPTPALKLAQMINAETLILKSNCGHLAVGCQLELCRAQIADFFENKNH